MAWNDRLLILQSLFPPTRITSCQLTTNNKTDSKNNAEGADRSYIICPMQALHKAPKLDFSRPECLPVATMSFMLCDIDISSPNTISHCLYKGTHGVPDRFCGGREGREWTRPALRRPQGSQSGPIIRGPVRILTITDIWGPVFDIVRPRITACADVCGQLAMSSLAGQRQHDSAHAKLVKHGYQIDFS